MNESNAGARGEFEAALTLLESSIAKNPQKIKSLIADQYPQILLLFEVDTVPQNVCRRAWTKAAGVIGLKINGHIQQHPWWYIGAVVPITMMAGFYFCKRLNCTFSFRVG